jgi:hypothetical protein
MKKVVHSYARVDKTLPQQWTKAQTRALNEVLHFPILSTLPKSQQNFKTVTKGSCKKIFCDGLLPSLQCFYEVSALKEIDNYFLQASWTS